MDIPEEEIEQAIIWDLGLLKIRTSGKLQLIERQRTLSTADGFIDLFLKDNKRYYVVELKRDYIKNQKVVTEQVLRYRNSLCEELKVSPEKIVCIVASPQGCSDEVKRICKINRVIAKKLSEDRILSVLADRTKEHGTYEKQETIAKIILRRRQQYFGLDRDAPNLVNADIKSTWNWINNHEQDDQSKRRIAYLFREISSKAPIQAHQVHDENVTKDSYQLKSFEDEWFWLFYTILDKRSNASTFIKARRILEKDDLFLPQKIIEYAEKYGKPIAVDRITTLLEKNGFPLLHDFKLRKYAVATSIIDAADMISKYHYNFAEFYNYHINSNGNDLRLAYDAIRNELNSIYGVGPRMISQFIRGMVLKGNWNLPLTHDEFLEQGRFNVYFAGPARLSLVKDEKDYNQELGKLADDYLEGNRAVISHALWYVRKKYCGKAKHCNECPMAGHCSYYLKSNTIRLYKEKQDSIITWIPYAQEIVEPQVNLEPISQ